MMDKYILVGHEVVIAPSDDAYYRQFEDLDSRRVASTEIDNVHISTVFLCLDHGFGDGPPVLFETMIFGGEHNDYQERCCTWDEAVAMHQRAVRLVLEGVTYYKAITEDDD